MYRRTKKQQLFQEIGQTSQPKFDLGRDLRQILGRLSRFIEKHFLLFFFCFPLSLQKSRFSILHFVFLQHFEKIKYGILYEQITPDALIFSFLPPFTEG